LHFFGGYMFTHLYSEGIVILHDMWTELP